MPGDKQNKARPGPDKRLYLGMLFGLPVALLMWLVLAVLWWLGVSG